MTTFQDLIKSARLRQGFKSREVAQAMGVDQAMLSRFERGQRLPTEQQVHELAKVLAIDEQTLMKAWLTERVLKEVANYSYAKEVILMVSDALPENYTLRPTQLTNDVESILADIDRLKERLNDIRYRDNQRIAEALRTEYIYESNRIEGNTLTLNETQLVVQDGLTISGKTMREHLEAINHADAIEFVLDLVKKNAYFTERDLLQLHQLVVRGVHKRDAGKYRKVPVMITGSNHTPPQPWQVATEMEQYFTWYNQNCDLLHPVVLAAEMHERLVTIHPFIDGNGRTSRLVMNLILLKHGYVIANIRGDATARAAYYDALESCRSDSNKNAFIKLVAETELSCLQRYLEILG
jgi:Fic family protein